jgi:hypothetical protein
MDDENQRHGSKLRAVVWAVTLMFCSFVGGVFVGQHPEWIPLPAWVPGGPKAADATEGDLHQHQLPLDATTPTTQPETQIPQTQPSGQ